MLRDPEQLASRTFDVLVVGGGIYGLTIACDAAERGASVALIERDDFGSGSSFNHLRTIHGGLRYLQHLDLPRARESVRERRALARIAPHALTPMPFALPLYRSVTRGRLAMRAGFLIDRIVAAGRNRDVVPALRLPAGRVVSRQHAIEQFPGLRRRGLTGAAVWHDYVTPEADRLTFSWALAAAAHGAVLANHVEALSVAKEGRRVSGVSCVDRLSGRTFEIAAKTVVNATGGAVDRLLGSAGLSTGLPMLKAMNLVTRRDAGDAALGGRSASGRNLFLVPWRRRALFGTWESSQVCRPDQASPTEAEVASFIAELNEAFPALDLRRSDVALVHRGVVPAVATSNGVALEGNQQVRDHAGDGVEGLFSVVGAKYTTARAVAEQVVDRVLSDAARPRGSVPYGVDSASRRACARRHVDDRGRPPRIRPLRAERHDPAPGRRVWVGLSRGDGAVAHPARVVRAACRRLTGDRWRAGVGRASRDGRNVVRRGPAPHAARRARISRRSGGRPRRGAHGRGTRVERNADA